jgi:predicted anti-sigma-YlaC factor YlaD
MKCRQFEKLIMEHFDGSLSNRDHIILSEHLDQCPGCRMLFEDISDVVGTLEKTQIIQVPIGLSEEVCAKIALLPIDPGKEKMGIERVIYGLLGMIGVIIVSLIFLVLSGYDIVDGFDAINMTISTMYGYFVDLQTAYRIISMPFSAEISFYRWQIQIIMVCTLALLIGYGVKMAWKRDVSLKERRI